MKYCDYKNKIRSGMTLIEMMVAIAIFSIGMAGFTLLFSKVWQGNNYTLEMGQSTMAVSQGVNTIMDYIRRARQSDGGSFPVVSAADNDLVLYSDFNKDNITERLHFYKSGQQVLMGVTNPTSTMPKTYPAGDQQIITIANSIVNNSSTPIFYYYDHNYTGGAGQNSLTTPVSVSAIRLVKIFLQININPNRAPDNIQMQSFVELRNLNDYNQIQ
jgi:prepilin-type N-terminal cleavage/methylation domain-containing protein